MTIKTESLPMATKKEKEDDKKLLVDKRKPKSRKKSLIPLFSSSQFVMKHLFNHENFNKLSESRRKTLSTLLPQIDVVAQNHDVTLKQTAFNNEYFNHALEDFKDRVMRGELQPNGDCKPLKLPKSRLDPWKAANLEEYWGEKFMHREDQQQPSTSPVVLSDPSFFSSIPSVLPSTSTVSLPGAASLEPKPSIPKGGGGSTALPTRSSQRRRRPPQLGPAWVLPALIGGRSDSIDSVVEVLKRPRSTKVVLPRTTAPPVSLVNNKAGSVVRVRPPERKELTPAKLESPSVSCSSRSLKQNSYSPGGRGRPRGRPRGTPASKGLKRGRVMSKVRPSPRLTVSPPHATVNSILTTSAARAAPLAPVSSCRVSGSDDSDEPVSKKSLKLKLVRTGSKLFTSLPANDESEVARLSTAKNEYGISNSVDYRPEDRGNCSSGSSVQILELETSTDEPTSSQSYFQFEGISASGIGPIEITESKPIDLNDLGIAVNSPPHDSSGELELYAGSNANRAVGSIEVRVNTDDSSGSFTLKCKSQETSSESTITLSGPTVASAHMGIEAPEKKIAKAKAAASEANSFKFTDSLPPNSQTAASASCTAPDISDSERTRIDPELAVVTKVLPKSSELLNSILDTVVFPKRANDAQPWESGVANCCEKYQRIQQRDCNVNNVRCSCIDSSPKPNSELSTETQPAKPLDIPAKAEEQFSSLPSSSDGLDIRKLHPIDSPVEPRTSRNTSSTEQAVADLLGEVVRNSGDVSISSSACHSSSGGRFSGFSPSAVAALDTTLANTWIPRLRRTNSRCSSQSIGDASSSTVGAVEELLSEILPKARRNSRRSTGSLSGDLSTRTTPTAIHPTFSPHSSVASDLISATIENIERCSPKLCLLPVVFLDRIASPVPSRPSSEPPGNLLRRPKPAVRRRSSVPLPKANRCLSLPPVQVPLIGEEPCRIPSVPLGSPLCRDTPSPSAPLAGLPQSTAKAACVSSAIPNRDSNTDWGTSSARSSNQHPTGTAEPGARFKSVSARRSCCGDTWRNGGSASAPPAKAAQPSAKKKSKAAVSRSRPASVQTIAQQRVETKDFQIVLNKLIPSDEPSVTGSPPQSKFGTS